MGVTVTGLNEAMSRVDRFPDTLVKQLGAVASRVAHTIAGDAARRLLAQRHAPVTAATIGVIDESDKKQFVVDVSGDPDRPENLPLWLERGTRHMAAKPYLRPAGDAQSDTYQRDMSKTAEDALKELVS